MYLHDFDSSLSKYEMWLVWLIGVLVAALVLFAGVMAPAAAYALRAAPGEAPAAMVQVTVDSNHGIAPAAPQPQHAPPPSNPQMRSRATAQLHSYL